MLRLCHRAAGKVQIAFSKYFSTRSLFRFIDFSACFHRFSGAFFTLSRFAICGAFHPLFSGLIPRIPNSAV
jgi:hypothetical protein